MKYANVIYKNPDMNHLGDQMQIIAIDNLYQKMGIAPEDIIYIPRNELSSYNGEYALLPVNLPKAEYNENGYAGHYSKHIIPVFLGLCLMPGLPLSNEEITYFKCFEPIGCRDESTMELLRSYEITAYLNGCLTFTLPLVEIDRSNLSKVIICDCHKEVLNCIPKELWAVAEFDTHIIWGPSDNPKQDALILYEKYKKEAALVITSRLHCAIPCLAAGIPVVLALEKCSFRFGWLEKILPIYTKDEFNNINWNPSAPNIEQIKEKIMTNNMSHVSNAFKKHAKSMDISYFWESRNKKEYIIDGMEYLKANIDAAFRHNPSQRYAVWGMTQLARLIVAYIKKHYPMALMERVFDRRTGVSFEGLKAEAADNISSDGELFVFVTAGSALKEAEELFRRIGKKEDSYMLTPIEPPKND